MRGNRALNHVALALANRRHVDRDGTGFHAELRGVVHQMRDLGTPNLVLAGQAGDVGTGAADPAAFHDGSPPPRPCQVPGEELAPLSAAKNEDVEAFRCRHGLSPYLWGSDRAVLPLVHLRSPAHGLR